MSMSWSGNGANLRQGSLVLSFGAMNCSGTSCGLLLAVLCGRRER